MEARVLLVCISSGIIAIVDDRMAFSVLDLKVSSIRITIMFAYTMLIPGIIILIFYCATGIVLKANTLKHENTRAMELRRKQNVKVLKMFAVITICFFIFTMPLGMWHVCFWYLRWQNSWKLAWQTEAILHTTCRLLYAANICINPLIYAKMHRAVNIYIRRLIKKFTRACCQCCSNWNQEATLQ